MAPEHWPAVCEIYREGIATGNATFETDVPDWNKWNDSHRPDCRLIALETLEPWAPESEIALGKGSVLGWAALSPVSSRYVYRGVAEVSVYVAWKARGHGIGKALLQALVEASEISGIWTLQAGIFPENQASLAIHRSSDFREVGVRRHIGKFGHTWRDVLLFERRSRRVGL
jgi:L-amino acid N-acyltransferase YncA